MADFHQNGNIAQFHNLRIRPVNEIEYDLETFSQSRKISLILPSLYSELDRAGAARNPRRTVAGARYLHRIIIGLDRADETEFRKARDFFSRLPQDHVVLWNDGPRMRRISTIRSTRLGLAPHERGKGKNVWTCMGYLIACARHVGDGDS